MFPTQNLNICKIDIEHEETTTPAELMFNLVLGFLKVDYTDNFLTLTLEKVVRDFKCPINKVV